jgi:hypothetical protein
VVTRGWTRFFDVVQVKVKLEGTADRTDSLSGHKAVKYGRGPDYSWLASCALSAFRRCDEQYSPLSPVKAALVLQGQSLFWPASLSMLL